ncbi:AAA family ATPase [Pseudomonas viridiflava]|uniref:AAA family ATPase n=1 Tax=Pseudomonas viridiflava TaxID=33069 RepID=UPI000F0445C6|nr:AAA family ATPase [Pseudomonas viridiflava]
MRLPSFTELFPEQYAILDSPTDESILVVGPPGSGKTSMAIWRACLLVSPEHQKEVVLITRNRLLSSVADQLAIENDGAEIHSTTMHTYFSKDYYSRFGDKAPTMLYDSYEYNWETILRQYGEADIQPDLDHLIIDEGQNLPLGFVQWALRYKARAVSIFADEHQSTSSSGCRISDLADEGFQKSHILTMNHRNTQEIGDVIAHFHSDRRLPAAAPRRGGGYDRPNLIPIDSWENLADVISRRLNNRAESIGVIVFNTAHVEIIADLLRRRLPLARVDSYKNTDASGAENAIQMRRDGITVLSGESAIGLEFDTLYLQDLSRSLPTLEPIQKRRLYMLCARARDKLVLVNGPISVGLLNKAQLTSLPPDPILER